MEIRVEPVGGRFVEVLRAMTLQEGILVEVELLDGGGLPWLVHPAWWADPATPAVLTGFLRADLVDRAVDLRAMAWWKTEGLTGDLRSYSDWAAGQRARLGWAVICPV